MNLKRHARRACLALAAVAPLALAPAASAHANLSPPTVQAKQSQLFTLAVPTEKEDATTTSVTLTVPEGMSIDSFEAAPGWTRSVKATGEGEDAVVQSVTWSGGKTPAEEVSAFRFLGQTTKSVTVPVRQTYSDGTVVDWSGAEDSDAPAVQLEAVSSLGGGGSDTLAIIAIVLGAVALVLSAVVLASGRSRALA